jgi:hypothetical protein
METKELTKTTFRMNESYRALIAKMAKKTKLSRSQVMRIALDKMAKEMGLSPASESVPTWNQ